jgi:alkaline phosphatase D
MLGSAPMNAFLRLFLLFVAALASTPLASAAGRLLWGPMLGYVEHREARILLEAAEATRIELTYWPAARPGETRTLALDRPVVTPAGGNVAHFTLPLLEPGTRYDYRIALDGQPVARPYPLTFTTKSQFEWRAPAPDFSFVFGTCAYLNDPPSDRPGKPYGQGTAIFERIADSGASFMLWGGDNLYLRESDWSSESGIWYRYQQDRRTPDLQRLLAVMPHFATWDDHDFGPNNSNTAYEFKGVALAAFKAYWGNRTWGEPDNPGVYGKFQWSDAAFFLLDNRYHRDESELDQSLRPAKTQYGRRQVDWLKQHLASMNEGNNRRHSPLRFIVTGGQFLSERAYPGSEDHLRYAAERAELIQFIKDHRIGGVVLLSGDVHYTELQRRTDLLPYPLYELTSSALSSGPHTGKLPPSPTRVEGTLVQANNYCRIAVSGPTDARIITLTSHDPSGAQLWQHVIRASDLQWPKQ